MKTSKPMKNKTLKTRAFECSVGRWIEDYLLEKHSKNSKWQDIADEMTDICLKNKRLMALGIEKKFFTFIIQNIQVYYRIMGLESNAREKQ